MHTAHWSGVGAVLLTVVAMSACNVDRLLNTKDKDTSTPGSITSASGLPNARAGAISQFQVAYSGSAAGGGSSNEGQINMTALLTDEYIDLETFPTRITVDNRDAEPGNGTLRGIFLDMSQSRVSAERAGTLYQQFDSTNVFHAEMLNLAAYTYVLFAEDYCSGVPFDAVNANGSITNGQPLTTDSIYGRALADFTAALKLATSDSAASGDPKAIEQINVARVGTARVLLDRAQFAAAGAVAALVPSSFEYDIESSSNTPRENNGIWYFTTQLAFSVADLEGGNGLNFLSAGDPRVQAVDAGTPGFSGIGPDFQIEQKYKSPTDPIPLATGLEARLIIAEAQLNAGNIGGWRATLNALRLASSDTLLNKHPLKADSTTAANPTLRVDVMFRERAFWLYLTAHRLSDMRRLIRQYGRNSESVFPTGTDLITGAPYGTSIEFPVSSDESNNPNFHGCLNNNA